MFTILLQLLLAVNSPNVTIDKLAKINNTNPLIELANTMEKDFVKEVDTTEELRKLHKNFENNVLINLAENLKENVNKEQKDSNTSVNVINTTNQNLRQAFIHKGVVYQTSGFVAAANTRNETDFTLLQNVIDSGQIGVLFNTIALDGKPTHVAGHNPGVFSRIANTIQYGDIIKAYDDNGMEIQYRVQNIFVQNNRADQGDTYITNENLSNYVMRDIYNREDFVIQYCIGTSIYIVQCVLV